MHQVARVRAGCCCSSSALPASSSTLDQVTKALAVAHLTEDQPRNLVGSALRLHLVRNAGAAFSTATGMTWVLTLVAAGRRGRRHPGGPAAGQPGLGADPRPAARRGAGQPDRPAVPRARASARGHVVDFLEFPHWPIFNLADSAIVTAGVLVVLLTLTGVGLDGGDRSADEAEPRPTRAEMADHRSMPVPDGLAGERVDVGADPAVRSVPQQGGRPGGRGRRAAGRRLARPSPTGCTPGRGSRSTLPDPPRAAEVGPRPVDGLVIVHEDDDLVVVDKPVGVAAHPARAGPGRPCWPGWPPPAYGSPRPARPSGRGSCTGWTSARAG